MRVVAGKGVEGLAASAERRGPTGGRRLEINPPAQSEDLNLAVPLSIFISFHSHSYSSGKTEASIPAMVLATHKSIEYSKKAISCVCASYFQSEIFLSTSV
jgi:hypothetical protein